MQFPRKRLLVNAIAILATIGYAASIGATQPFTLITDQEYRESLAAPKPVLARGLQSPDAPRIYVDSPTPGQPSKSPASIVVRFMAAGEAKIRPDSFKILYGNLRFDVTDRVLKTVRVSEVGFRVDGAQLPHGTHSFRLLVEDNLGRKAEQDFRFEIL
jgi:hypothetical protein